MEDNTTIGIILISLGAAFTYVATIVSLAEKYNEGIVYFFGFILPLIITGIVFIIN